MAYIIQPIAVLFWAAWRALASVDQNIYWVLLVVFCAILVLRLIPEGKDRSASSAYNNTHKPLNRVEFWQAVFKDAALGKKESDFLRDNLRQLLLAVVAQTERSDLTESGEIIANEQAPLSPAARRYLFTSSERRGVFSRYDHRAIRFLAPRWFRKRTRIFVRQDETLIDEILRQMEADLEISPGQVAHFEDE